MEDKEPLRGLRVLKGAWVLKILSTSIAQRRNHGLQVQRGKCLPALVSLRQVPASHPQCLRPAQLRSG